MDTTQQLMEQLQDFKNLILHDEDSREAQWYEPWNLILNWLRVRTHLRLTVAPQFSITREYYEKGDEDYSIIADTSFSSDSDTNEFVVKDQGRAPDFSIFFRSGDFSTRSFPLIIEIKPYHPIRGDTTDGIVKVMENTREQLLEQVAFALDKYKILNVIHIICVVGWHWDMLEFNGGPNTELASGKYFDKGKHGKLESDHIFQPRHLLNSNTAPTGFSDGFKAAWTKAMIPVLPRVSVVF